MALTTPNAERYEFFPKRQKIISERYDSFSER